MKDQTMISVKLSKTLLEQAKEIAKKEEITVSALIRKLLISYVNKE